MVNWCTDLRPSHWRLYVQLYCRSFYYSPGTCLFIVFSTCPRCLVVCPCDYSYCYYVMPTIFAVSMCTWKQETVSLCNSLKAFTMQTVSHIKSTRLTLASYHALMNWLDRNIKHRRLIMICVTPNCGIWGPLLHLPKPCSRPGRCICEQICERRAFHRYISLDIQCASRRAYSGTTQKAYNQNRMDGWNFEVKSCAWSWRDTTRHTSSTKPLKSFNWLSAIQSITQTGERTYLQGACAIWSCAGYVQPWHLWNFHQGHVCAHRKRY